MTFTVSPACPSDIPYLSIIQWAALLSNPLTQTLYPQGPTRALTAFTRESYQKAIEFPGVRLIKATDPERGQIVAFAKWIIYPEEQGKLVRSNGTSAEDGEVKPASVWGNVKTPSIPEGVNEKALGAWNGIITKTRTKIMQNRKHTCDSEDGCSMDCYFASVARALWVLDIIHTHPSHQGRGAAAQLLKWGTDLADEMRIPCYVESSPLGYPLFKRKGFEKVTEMEIDLSKYRSSQGAYRYKHTVMIRIPKIPPIVPPKDLATSTAGECNFGFPVENTSSNKSNGRHISGKASLIEIKRSPRPDRQSSSTDSNGMISPKPIRTASSQALNSILSLDSEQRFSHEKTDSKVDSVISPEPKLSRSSRGSDTVSLIQLDSSDIPRKSESVSSLTGRFPEPPSKPASKPASSAKSSPPVERVWFSEHHT
ncbi:hypothetical protein ACLMJK_004853 [Lecanora helva]